MADFQDFNEILTCDEEIDDEVVQNEKVVHKEEKKTSATGKRKKTAKKWTTGDTNRLIDLLRNVLVCGIYFKMITIAERKKKVHTMRLKIFWVLV